MDPAEASQMIAWLEEELRKNKAQIAEMRDLVNKQTIEIGDQRKRIEDLQSRLTKLQTDFTRISQVDQAIAQVKTELAGVLHDVREEIRRSDQQALQSRQIEREADAKALLELSQRVEKFAVLPERLSALGAEQQRLNEALIMLRQRSDEIDKTLVRLADQDRLNEEGYKRQSGRIDVLQQSLDGIRNQTSGFSARFQYLEKWAQGSAQRAAEQQAFRTDLQRALAEVQEAQRRSEQKVEKQIREWATITEGSHRDQELWTNQLRVFAEQHERTKRSLTGIQDLAKEMRAAYDELRAIVDMHAEKQRRDLREWQGENEKRWTRYLAQWEYRWSEQHKVNEVFDQRLNELDKMAPPIHQALQELRVQLADEAAAARAAVLELWRFELEAWQHQVDAIKVTADKLHAQLKE